MARLKVGVLLLSKGAQLLDVSAVDLLGMMEPYYLKACQLPEPIVSKGIEIEWHYISEAGPAETMLMTAGVRYGVTDSLVTCPPLDLLLVGGPEVSYRPSTAVQQFLHAQLPHLRAFFSVCTAIFSTVQMGLVKDKEATAPRGLLPMLKQLSPDTTWVEQRWCRDGKIWTSGGITNGHDMMAAYMREAFDRQLVELVLSMADVGERGQDYAGPMKGMPT